MLIANGGFGVFITSALGGGFVSRPIQWSSTVVAASAPRGYANTSGSMAQGRIQPDG
jgi:hypothetical protein